VGWEITNKYTRLYAGADPKFEEGDIFRTIIPLKEVATEKVGGNPERAQEEFKKSLGSPSKVPRKSLEKNQRHLDEIENKIRQMLEKNSLITRGEIAEKCGISEKTVTRYIKKMKEFKYIN